MNWFTAAVWATLFFAVYPIFGNKAGQIHGERMNFIIDGVIMFLICIALSIIYPGDFRKVTKTSFYFALPLGLSSIGFILMLYAWRVAPDKMLIINITIGFSTVITAVLSGIFTNVKLDRYQWVGALVSFLGIAMVNKVTVGSIINLFKP